MEKQKTDTFFLNLYQSKPFTRSTSKIEVDDVELLVINLLAEFENSSEEQKKRYEPLLIDWLKKMDEKELFAEDQQKVRDFIYEMF